MKIMIMDDEYDEYYEDEDEYKEDGHEQENNRKHEHMHAPESKHTDQIKQFLVEISVT